MQINHQFQNRVHEDCQKKKKGNSQNVYEASDLIFAERVNEAGIDAVDWNPEKQNNEILY